MPLVNTVERLLSLKLLFWRKKMTKVLRHGDQILRMTQLMKINARTILSGVEHICRLLSIHVGSLCSMHLPDVKLPSGLKHIT